MKLSTQTLSCGVGINEHALGYPVEYWTHQAFWTSAQIDKGTDPAKLKRIHELLASKRVPCGTYLSGGGCRKQADMLYHPAETVPYESMPPSAYRGSYGDMEPNMSMVDLDQQDARERFGRLIACTAGLQSAPWLVLDNVAHPVHGTKISWEDSCRHLSYTRKLCNALGFELWPNIAAAPGFIPERDAEHLAHSIDGMTIEMGLMKNVWSDSRRTELALETFRQWLVAGLNIVLIPQPIAPEEFCAALALMLRGKNYNIWVNHPFFQDPAPWLGWKDKLGKIKDGPTVGVRELSAKFEGGTLRVALNSLTVQVE